MASNTEHNGNGIATGVHQDDLTIPVLLHPHNSKDLASEYIVDRLNVQIGN